MTGFVSCPPHVRSADLGTATVLISLRTGRVDALLGWGHRAWRELARTGNSRTVAHTLGVPAGQASALVDQLLTDGFLAYAQTPCPWPIPGAPPTTSSWGTSEVPAAISPRRSTGFAVTALAGLALAGVLAARDLGRRDRSFGRITALIGAAAGWPHRAADPQMVADALHCV
ncbi:MAG: hypothetical protein ACRDQU_14395, partial [Pseudonocardiaceae bacterium]